MITINMKKKLKFSVSDTKFANEKVARAFAQLFVGNLFTLKNLQRENRRNVERIHATKLAYYRFLVKHTHNTHGLYNVNVDYLEYDLVFCECDICKEKDLIAV